MGVYLKVKVGGVECNLLVDTGAQVFIVSQNFWREATGGGAELLDYEGRVAVADGSQMEILGRWQATCQFDNLVLIVDFFLVADIMIQEILLGTDFLQKFKAVIDLGSRQCSIMGKKLPLFFVHDVS